MEQKVLGRASTPAVRWQAASYTSGGAAYHTFLWKPTTPNGASGTKTDLGTLGGTQSFGNGVNASGQVTGESSTTGDVADRAFLWKPTAPGGASGTMYNLGTLGGTNSYGYGINAAGQVTGASDTTGDSDHSRISVETIDAERHQRHDARPGNARRNRKQWERHQRQRSGGRLVP